MRRNVSSCINFVLRSKSPTTKYWCSARLPSLTNAVMTIRKYFFFFFTCPIFFANKLYSMWFQGEDNVEYYLGLTPTGVIVLRNKNIVANYYWWVHNVFVSNSFSRLGYIADEAVFLFFIFNLFPVFFKIFDSIKKKYLNTAVVFSSTRYTNIISHTCINFTRKIIQFEYCVHYVQITTLINYVNTRLQKC